MSSIDILFQDTLEMSSSQACLTDLTPPTFAGISSLTPTNNGALVAAWAAATDVTTPIEYLIYIALGAVSAATLFQSSNLVAIAPSSALMYPVFTLADQTTYIVKGQTYTLGVRAKDAVGNVNTNLVVLSDVAIGSVDIAGIFQTLHTQFQADHADFQSDHANFLADHANFVADDAAFDADHANFLADHANFLADHADFQVDHANFLADHANFQADDAAYDVNNTNFAANIQDLVDINIDLSATANTLVLSNLTGIVEEEGEIEGAT